MQEQSPKWMNGQMGHHSELRVKGYLGYGLIHILKKDSKSASDIKKTLKEKNSFCNIKKLCTDVNLSGFLFVSVLDVISIVKIVFHEQKNIQCKYKFSFQSCLNARGIMKIIFEETRKTIDINNLFSENLAGMK
jgi:hypothetical protein